MSTEATFPAGRNVEGKLSQDGKTLHLTINLSGVPWESNGPKHNKLSASTGGFITLASGHRVSLNVLAPK